MKKVLAAAALLASGASAQAADLPVPAAPYFKAPVVQVYDWTGFYVGVNLGVGQDRSYTGLSAFGSTAQSRLGANGFMGGGQIGYNWQYNNFLGLGLANVVLGLETDLQGGGIKDNTTCIFLCSGGVGFGLNQKLDWFGTARGRIGLANGPVLSYVTGGVAYGDVKTTVTDLSALGTATSFSETRVGWTVGSGVEASLGGNWTAKIEWLYIDLGSQSGTSPVGAANAYAFSSNVREQIFRGGLNYRIGGNGTYMPETTARWAGFYGGANVGGATAMNQVVDARLNKAAEVFNVSPNGYIGGGQVGYNWQWGNVVFGAEADFQGSSQSDDKVCQLTCGTFSSIAIDQKMDWFGTARGRFGYSVGSTLFYATAGYAYGDVKTTYSGMLFGSPIGSQSFSHSQGGYAVGAGIESPFNLFGWFGPNWSTKTEYLFVDLGHVNDLVVPTAGGAGMNYATRIQEQTFRTGLNYHFSPL
jgi:outer membrane immunogenic protein